MKKKQKISIGQTYGLKILKISEIGAFLDASELGEILLPGKYVPDDIKPGATIEVFLYLDSEDRPIATTKVPKAKIGEFAYLEVVANTISVLFWIGGSKKMFWFLLLNSIFA